MNQAEKDALFADAKAHVQEVCARLVSDGNTIGESLKKTLAKLRGPQTPELELERRLYQFKAAQHAAIASLASVPFFFRCDAQMQKDAAPKTMYFAKHTRPEESIFSWVSPAAALRFEPIGAASYAMPDGTVRTATVSRKDQYMIVDGKIVFMASENASHPRTLVHQEHFTTRKRGFVLPDIVAQMEKAQDTVIRAPHKGSFLIAGPAGSGKTTLALHRVAYLAQSPDTAALFPHEEIVVFVQDTSAKDYFGALLPDLGINGVTVCTFHEWALRMLKLTDHAFANRWSQDEAANDEYLFAKRRSLDVFSSAEAKSRKDHYDYLLDAYAPRLTAGQLAAFEEQREAKWLDRFDLAILLRRAIHDDGSLREDIEYHDRKVRGKLTMKVSRTTVRYSLIVVDEAENWLAEELTVLRGCINQETQALVYVGDLAQRTQLGTVRSWNDVGEDFPAERKVVLEKVYRNTRQILEYAASLGYDVNIPSSLQDGKPVAVHADTDVADYCDKVVASADADGTVGVLAKHERDIARLRARYADKVHVKVMTVDEAQGMEFDITVIVAMRAFEDAAWTASSPALQEERNKMNRDLRYVAITRAMQELHVLG